MDKIGTLLEQIDTLPASPALLPRLAQLLGDINKTDVHEIVDIVMFDSALTAKLLQIANSAYFGVEVSFTNVGDAIGLLGYDIVFLLAAAISTENCMKVPPGTGLDSVVLWRHSVTSAFGAQYVARASGQDGNLAFTTGLLHDLGKVVFAETYGKIYTTMFDPDKRGGKSLVEWEKDNYGCDHAEVGAVLLQNWRLPKPLVAGVKYHYRVSAAGDYAPLAACVCLGNALSHTLEKPVFLPDKDDPEVQQSLKILNLTIDDLRNQWGSIRQKWDFVQTLVDLRK